MKKDELYTLLKKYVSFNEKEVAYKKIAISNVSLEKVNELLVRIGKIEIENRDEQYCIISVNAGLSAFSGALLLVAIDSGSVEILSYAKEGIISQNIAKRNLGDAEELLLGNPIGTRIKPNILLIYIIAIVMALTVLGSVITKPKKIDTGLDNISDTTENTLSSENDDSSTNQESNNEVEMTVLRDSLITKYNTAITNYNNVASAYNEEVLLISIANISNLPNSIELIGEVSNDCDLSNEEIAAEVDGMPEKIDMVLSNYAIVHKLNKLEKEDVVSALEQLSNVVNIESVTEKNDPNGLLGKENGYVSCTYFMLDLVDSSGIPGNTAIEKGTDAGGCIELYRTVEDAMERCEYLGQFDDTLLYSGSYAIVGKAVIRTSYMLSNQQQISITEQITRNILQ